MSSSPIYRHRGLKVRYSDPLPSGETVPEPVPVGCLVFPQYDPGATSQLTELSALESLQRFIEARVFIGNPIESRKVEDLLDWIAGVRRYALRYSDLGQAARMVRELLTQ
ncbi:MAG: hypothetical protein LJE70_18030 [Chromatiaceae bacterium]|nr:hypothetical protein [Chromatiaceae bacterium]